MTDASLMAAVLTVFIEIAGSLFARSDPAEFSPGAGLSEPELEVP